MARKDASPEIRAVGVRRHLVANAFVHRFEPRARLREADTLTPPRENAEPRRAVSLPDPRGRIRLCGERHPEVDGLSRRLAGKAATRDAHDDERGATQAN